MDRSLVSLSPPTTTHMHIFDCSPNVALIFVGKIDLDLITTGTGMAARRRIADIAKAVQERASSWAHGQTNFMALLGEISQATVGTVLGIMLFDFTPIFTHTHPHTHIYMLSLLLFFHSA